MEKGSSSRPASTSSSINTEDGKTVSTRYDEFGNYFDQNGTPSQPPAPLQGKNRGFDTGIYQNPKPRNDYNQGGYSDGYGRDNRRNYNGGDRYQGGGGDRYQGGGGRNYNNNRNYGGGRNNRRRYDDDFDDDPVLAEFGGDDYEDDRYNRVSKEEEEKLERAFQLESNFYLARKKRSPGSLPHRTNQ